MLKTEKRKEEEPRITRITQICRRAACRHRFKKLHSVLYLGSSRCARPLPHGFAGHVAHPIRSIHQNRVADLCSLGFDQLVGAAKAIGQDAHYFNREIRRLLDQELKTLLIDRDQFANGTRGRSGSARRSIDHCHLAKDPARLHDFDDFVADGDFHFAFAHHEHERARVTLAKDRLAGGERLELGLMPEHVEPGHNARVKHAR